MQSPRATWNIKYKAGIEPYIIAATTQLYEWSCLSVRPSRFFTIFPFIASSWNFQELLPMTEMQKLE